MPKYNKIHLTNFYLYYGHISDLATLLSTILDMGTDTAKLKVYTSIVDIINGKVRNRILQ